MVPDLRNSVTIEESPLSRRDDDAVPSAHPVCVRIRFGRVVESHYQSVIPYSGHQLRNAHVKSRK